MFLYFAWLIFGADGVTSWLFVSPIFRRCTMSSDGSASSDSEEEEEEESEEPDPWVWPAAAVSPYRMGSALDSASRAMGRPNWSPDYALCKEGAIGMARFYLDVASTRAMTRARVDYQLAQQVFLLVQQHLVIMDWSSYQQPVDEALSTWRDSCRIKREPLSEVREEFGKRVRALLDDTGCGRRRMFCTAPLFLTEERLLGLFDEQVIHALQAEVQAYERYIIWVRRVLTFGYILREQEGASAAASMEEPEHHCFLHEEWSSDMLWSGSMSESESEAGSSMEGEPEPEAPEAKRPKLQAAGPHWVAIDDVCLTAFGQVNERWAGACLDKEGKSGR